MSGATRDGGGRPIVVLKFGGSVLVSEASIEPAIEEVRRWRQGGWSVVAVVSALAGETDTLLARCRAAGHEPRPEIVAAMAAIGEHKSAGLFGLALDGAGLRAQVLWPAAIGLKARGPATNADPVAVDAGLLRATLGDDGIAVVPGFTAVDERGRTVVLGRGGSDLTALFLAQRLQAERCRLVKDVDGLYEWDPAKLDDTGRGPRRYAEATWQDALRTDGSIIQHKALRFALEHRLSFELGTLGEPDPEQGGATLIGPGPTRLVKPARVTA